MRPEEPLVTLKLNSRLPLVLLTVFLFQHLVSPSRVWIYLICGLGGLLVVSYLWAREMAENVRASRELRYTWIQVGDLLEEQFSLVNYSFLPVLWAEINDGSDVPGYSASRVEALSANDERSWTPQGRCSRRGLFTLGPWQVRMGDPFGLFRVVLQYPEFETLLIYPPVANLPPIRLPEGTTVGSLRSPIRALHITTDAASIREYAPGDNLRRIHWPSTARRRKLMSKEFDEEPSGDLWIILDMDEEVQAGEGEESTEEYGVILASSLADQVLRDNRAVGLVAHSEKRVFIPQGRGRAQLWRILRGLARVTTASNSTLAETLEGERENLRRGTTALVITPSIDPEWVGELLTLSQQGIATTAILLDAPSFDDRTDGSTLAIRSLLADHGIPTHIVGQGYPFQIQLRQPAGRWEFKVLGTGRAIAVRRPHRAET
ncbi:MAG: DUF58 domain-containing protein [Chloroflexota bacterium]|nr:DUF58 domain-containing protein [Chloroflexota bacterium]